MRATHHKHMSFIIQHHGHYYNIFVLNVSALPAAVAFAAGQPRGAKHQPGKQAQTAWNSCEGFSVLYADSNCGQSSNRMRRVVGAGASGDGPVVIRSVLRWLMLSHNSDSALGHTLRPGAEQHHLDYRNAHIMLQLQTWCVLRLPTVQQAAGLLMCSMHALALQEQVVNIIMHEMQCVPQAQATEIFPRHLFTGAARPSHVPENFGCTHADAAKLRKRLTKVVRDMVAK